MFNMFKIVGDILRQRDVAVLCSRYIVLSTCCSCCALDDLAERFLLRGIHDVHDYSTCLTRGQYVDKEQNTSFTRL